MFVQFCIIVVFERYCKARKEGWGSRELQIECHDFLYNDGNLGNIKFSSLSKNDGKFCALLHQKCTKFDVEQPKFPLCSARIERIGYGIENGPLMQTKEKRMENKGERQFCFAYSPLIQRFRSSALSTKQI